jgi:hypothetical protein
MISMRWAMPRAVLRDGDVNLTVYSLTDSSGVAVDVHTEYCNFSFLPVNNQQQGGHL